MGYSNSTAKTNSAYVAGASEAYSEKTTASSLGNNNGRTTSRLGFTGTEDLGGGLRAGFNYEVALAADNIGHKVGTGDKAIDESARVGFGSTRLANISLSGGFGTVVLGTFLNSHDALRGFSAATFNMAGGDFMARHNANAADTGSPGATFVSSANTTLSNAILVGIMEDGAAYNAVAGTYSAGASPYTAAQIAAFVATSTAIKAVNGFGLNGRSANAVAYRSPTFEGFSLGLGLTTDKTKTTPTEKADTRTVAGQTVSIDYNQGPLKAMFVYGSAKNTALKANTVGKVTDSGFAVSYDMGVAVPYIQYETVKATNTALTGLELKTASTELGAKFPMGSFTPYVTLGTGTYKVAGLLPGTFPSVLKFKQTAVQIGSTYDLSKRTQVYAAYGMDEQKIESLSAKRSGLTAGLVHQF